MSRVTEHPWRHPVLYMSRATAREMWVLIYGIEPNLTGDLRYGTSRIPVLLDDTMPFGHARIEEDPDPGAGPERP